jgi:hypothetical protein
MKKELPYFKCFPDKWLAGDISTFGATEQGIFFNFCLFAWKNSGKLEIQENILCRRLQISEETLKTAINDFIKCNILLREESSEHYVIKFINEQLQDFGVISNIRSQAAYKKVQMQANALHKQANAEFCSAIKEEDKDKEKDKDKDKEKNNTIAPTCETKSEPTTEKPQWKRIYFDFQKWEWEQITEKDVEEWQSTFPACDIGGELAKMAGWIKANPAKGKKKNYAKFILNWLNRQQDRGGTR